LTERHFEDWEREEASCQAKNAKESPSMDKTVPDKLDGI
jgi:hypothetical protein